MQRHRYLPLIQYRKSSSSTPRTSEPEPIMASQSEQDDWLPERVENIFHAQNSTTDTQNELPTHSISRTAGSQNDNTLPQTEAYGSIVKNSVDERPGFQHSQTSSTEYGDEEDLRISRTQTSKSARERRQFAPIRSGDAEELQRIATSLEGAGGGSITRTSTRAEGLQRRDTLADVHIGDPVLNPNSPEFDAYKWARM